MALRIGELVGIIRADPSGWNSGVRTAGLRLRGLQRDANGRLRDMNGRFVRQGDQAGRGWSRTMASAIGRGLRSSIGGAVNAGLSGLSSVANKISSNPYVAGIGAAIGAGIITTLLPFLAAALSGLVIVASGLTVVGLGAALLKDEPKVKKAAKGLVSTAKKVFKDAAKPLAEPLTRGLRALEQTAKDIAPGVRESFRIMASSGAIESLTGGLDKLVKNLLPGFNKMLEDSGPVFEGFEEMLSEIGEGFSGFFEAIGSAGPDAKIALEDLGSAIKGLLIAAGETIAFLAKLYSAVRSHVEQVIGAFQWLYDKLIGHSIIPDLIRGIVRWFASLPGRVLGGLAAFVSSVIGKFASMASRAVSRTRNGAADVVRWLGGLPGRASGALGSLAGQVGARASAAKSRLTSAIRSGVSTAVSTVRGLPGRASGALSGIGSRLYGAGQSLISGFVRGIKSMISSVTDAASSVVSAARDFFPGSPAKRGAFSGRGWTLYRGQALIKGFQQGIAQQTPSLRQQLADLTTAAAGGLAGPDFAVAGGPFAGGRTGAGAGALVSIGEFHAGGRSERQIAEELHWLGKGRG